MAGVASMTMQAIVLADGDVVLVPAIDDRVARLAGRRRPGHRRRRRAASRRGARTSADRLGRRWRLGRACATSSDSRRTAPRCTGSTSAKDESDTELAMLVALERGATRSSSSVRSAVRASTTRSPTSACSRHPALARSPCAVARRVAPGLVLRAPAPDGVGDGAVAARTDRRHRVAAPARRRRRGRDDERAPRTRLTDEPLPAGPARGLSNVRHDAATPVTVRSGTLLIVESPATLHA